MFHRHHLRFLASWLLAFTVALPSVWAQPNHEKTVWNYDGGMTMMTDGSLDEGPCFRLSGRVTSDDFFENLKRVDTKSGTFFRRGNDIVTEFPGKLRLNFVMYDQPCPDRMQKDGTRVYLNHTIMSSLRIRFFWKRGTELRPAPGVVAVKKEAQPVPYFATQYTKELPQMYEWFFQFDVPSDGVPVTDSLVIVLYKGDGRIAARVAARM